MSCGDSANPPDPAPPADAPTTPDLALEAAVDIIRELRARGHVAVLAGGCVRDRLLGLEPKDVDVATDARPEQVQRCFRRSRLVGEGFGVVLVRSRGVWIEVATFRREGAYLDGRRPSEVEFADMAADAQRRDFTINGLFEDPLAEAPGERIIDHVGGRADLEDGLIRAIGDPHSRFAEDYLRLLRAVRFAARFNFRLEATTERAIRDFAPLLDRISRERIGQELRWMLERPSAPAAAAKVQALGLDAPVFTEPRRDVPLAMLERIAPDARFPVKLLAWAIDRHAGLTPPTAGSGPLTPHPPDMSPDADLTTWRAAAEAPLREAMETARKRWRRALCLTNEDTEMMFRSGALMVRLLHWPALSIARRKRLLADAGYTNARALLDGLRWVTAIDLLAPTIDTEAAPLLAEGVAPPPFVDGTDLIKMGLDPGPRFKELLDAVYDEQLENRVTNREQALRWLRENGGGGLSS